jgi:FkbM family methyltransferase
MKSGNNGRGALDVRVSKKWLRRVKRAIHRLLAVCGYELHRDPGLSLRRRVVLGHDLLRDLKTILGRDPRCIIDGGAHVGQTALDFADAFPEARIFSFEPAPDTFAELCRNTQPYPNIKPINAALGEENSVAVLHVNNDSQTNSLLEISEEAHQWLPAEKIEMLRTVEVPVYSLDQFVRDQVAQPVDLLKLDVQGYEFKVLRGAATLLAQASLPLVYLEICFVSYYQEQTSLPELYRLLYDYGYRLVSIYPSEFNAHGYKYRHGGDLLFVHESYGGPVVSKR